MEILERIRKWFRCRPECCCDNDEKKKEELLPKDDDLETTEEILALPRVSIASELFQKTQETIIFARYKWDGEWRVAKTRSLDPNDTFTVVWDDGFLQVGTKRQDIRLLSPVVLRAILAAFSEFKFPIHVSPEPQCRNEKGIETIWELAKRNQTEAVLKRIDAGESPNEPEMITGHAGRSVLYHACVAGNLELVAGLLARGAFDWDHSCRIAVTGNERADDERDLLFDPDLNTFSDFVDYPQEKEDTSLSSHVLKVKTKKHASSQYDQIRAMLKQNEVNAPRTLFRSALHDCCVCHASPPDGVSTCGHVACCRKCLRALHDHREGCPICRARIRNIYHVPTALLRLHT